MALTERKTVKYRSQLLRGLLEATADGTIVRDFPNDKDEPFVVQILRETRSRFFDSAGREHHSKNRSEDEVLAEVSVTDAAMLASSIASEIAFAYEVAERRVLTNPPKEN
jgi:hypothetical protein